VGLALAINIGIIASTFFSTVCCTHVYFLVFDKDSHANTDKLKLIHSQPHLYLSGEPSMNSVKLRKVELAPIGAGTRAGLCPIALDGRFIYR